MSGAPVVLTAGGTGGHVFPAQALAAELKRRGRDIVLITDVRGAGYEQRFPDTAIHAVRAGTPSGRGPFGRMMAMGEIAAGTLAARGLLKRLRPAAVVGFGGYPSLPAMLAATRLRLPTLLHEQNAILGRVNRLLAPRVAAIATSFADTAGIGGADLAKITVTGNPVRDAIAAVREVPYTAPQTNGPFRLLVLGGSQGARILSEVVPAALIQLPPEIRTRIRLTQQCRPEDLARVGTIYQESGIAADLAAFVEDVPALLASTHLCIARAGASTVAEIALAGRPVVLVPYAAAMDDHQTANAKTLVAAGGAWLMPEAKFTPGALRQTLDTLLQDSATLGEMAGSARGAGRPDAAAALADVVARLAPADGAAANDDNGRAAA
ncbi:MAG TPA: undecaprenyldiphospho-muramoylpentapeptide beta-N-acetylglucosaminyltransferase [Candidatus Sulfotelmatobacter sp.]|nr:undecaprenyldiphospho-muramoylpentapeptide beta-N-acetylglucosaminyltransferase [Candidatus Sulfotelmatobacter sp.]